MSRLRRMAICLEVLLKPARQALTDLRDPGFSRKVVAFCDLWLVLPDEHRVRSDS